MTDITHIIRDLPTIVDISYQKVETMDGALARHFVCFEWKAREFWIHGIPVWHNRMNLPPCLLHCGDEVRPYKASISVAHWHKPYKFWIYQPQARGAARGPWSFAGFSAGLHVNMDFVRDEAERLLAEEEFDLDDERITRPVKGKIV